MFAWSLDLGCWDTFARFSEKGRKAEMGTASRLERPIEGLGLVIDLNAATAAELDSVPALKGHSFEIVRYREERGRFTSLRQVDEVPSLCGKMDDVADHVTVKES